MTGIFIEQTRHAHFIDSPALIEKPARIEADVCESIAPVETQRLQVVSTCAELNL